jgi:hypothetical protein
MNLIKRFVIINFSWIKKTGLLIRYKYYYLIISLFSEKLPVEIFKDKNLLIVTAHPDDEVFCMAHVLQEIQPLANNITWINTTLGQNSINAKYFKSTLQTGIVREIEFTNSMKKLKIDNYLHLKIPSYLNSELPFEIMAIVKPEVDNCDYLFLIDKNDNHPDHNFTTKSLGKLKNVSQVFYFNVQKITMNSKFNYYHSYFNSQLYKELIGIYKSQSHMKICFDSYENVFNKKVFVYNENFN